MTTGPARDARKHGDEPKGGDADRRFCAASAILGAVSAGALGTERLDEAERHLREALHLDPARRDVVVALSTVHRLRGEEREAAALLAELAAR